MVAGRQIAAHVSTLLARLPADPLPKLDLRLRTVASLISAETHADIGSDHGGLLTRLLSEKQICHGIAVEHKLQPLRNSTAALAGLKADVRSGDGLGPIRCGEIDSLSVCGMGAELIVSILQQHPDRVPDHVVVQPNNKPALVRQWGWQNGFQLSDDITVPGKQRFLVLSFRRNSSRQDPLAPLASQDESIPSRQLCVDPAYEGLDLRTAFTFGPSAIRNPTPEFVRGLRDELAYFQGFSQLGPAAATRVKMIEAVLSGDVFADQSNESN